MSGEMFYFDLDGFLSDIEKVKLGLDTAKALVRASTRDVLGDIARDILSAAQIRLETQTRSGDLSRSATLIDPQDSGTSIIVGLGFSARYAAQRDQGGTILPKNGRCLAIPLDPVLTPAGVARYDSPLRDDGAPNGMFIVQLWGKLYLAQMLGPGHIEFRWLLVPSVTQKGSHFFTDAVQERQAQIGAIAAQGVKDDLERGAA